MPLMSVFGPFFELIANFMKRILAFTLVFGTVTAPSTTQPIEAVNPDEIRVAFTCLGDTQVNGTNGNVKYFEYTLQDIENAATSQDALVIVGDVTENSLDSEWKDITTLLRKYDFGKELILTSGNHDIRLRPYDETYKKFYNCIYNTTGRKIDSMIYSMEINGYTFIAMGSDRSEMEEAYISIEQLEWLDKTIAEATSTGKPVFVLNHQPLRETHGLPLTWGDGKNLNAGHIGKQSDLVKAVLNKHKNVIYITGHLHTGFGEYNYEKIGNFHSVNVPGAGKGNDNGEYCDYATGYSVEVYRDEVIFRARDFGKGVYLPEYDITIPVE